MVRIMKLVLVASDQVPPQWLYPDAITHQGALVYATPVIPIILDVRDGSHLHLSRRGSRRTSVSRAMFASDSM